MNKFYSSILDRDLSSNNIYSSIERVGDPQIEGEKDLSLPGILPVAKSTNTINDIKQGVIPLKQGVVWNEVKTNSNENKQNLENNEPELQRIMPFSREEKSNLESEPGQEVDNFRSLLGWDLVGHGSPYVDCGQKIVFGCDDIEAHKQSELDKDVIGKVYVKIKKRTCLRAECPICYEKWASKEAHKIAYRFSQIQPKRKSVHVVFSVPTNLWNVPLEDLRHIVHKLAKKVGIYGGSDIIHPFREKCQRCGNHKDMETKICENCGSSSFLWYFSPHFHVIGKGWILGNEVKNLCVKKGWVIVNLGVRISVEATAFYQLSHCGYKKNHHAVTWFGSMSYNKQRVKPEPIEKEVCPLCNSKLYKLIWCGLGEMPFKDEGDYFDDPKNWIKKRSLIDDQKRGRFYSAVLEREYLRYQEEESICGL